MNYSSLKITFVFKYFLYVLVSVIFFIMFVPLFPSFPREGLDPSFMLALNQAVMQGLIIGKDIIFTFGPYSNIFTKIYNPLLDDIFLLSSAILAFSYAYLIIVISKNEPAIILCIFLIGVLSIFHGPLTFYPILLSLGVYQYFKLKKTSHCAPSLCETIGILLTYVPLALLVCVKGTYILSSFFTLFLTSFLAFLNKSFRLGLAMIAVFIVSFILFWKGIGQPLSAIPDYFINMQQVIAGYSDSMSVWGNKNHIIFYICSSILLLAACFSREIGNLNLRVFLFASFFCFLFLGFKNGFIRHDGHERLSAITLIGASILFLFISRKKTSILFSLLGISVGLYIISKYNYNYLSFTDKVSQSVLGLKLRIIEPNYFYTRYYDALKIIKDKHNIPVLKGTTDLYDFNMAMLIASDNNWKPRPILQSYSVYTPKLARLNLQHLEQNSPDNILFNVKVIDNHLPSLDDGLSWPTIIANYRITDYKEKLLYLVKKNHKKEHSALINSPSYEIKARFNQNVVLPNSNQAFFAKIIPHQTFLGRLYSFLFKTHLLKIKLKLTDGTTKEYRLISGMSEAGFILTPFIENTSDFKNFALNSKEFIFKNAVKSIEVNTTRHGYHKLLWHAKYNIQLYTMNLNNSEG